MVRNSSVSNAKLYIHYNKNQKTNLIFCSKRKSETKTTKPKKAKTFPNHI